MTKEKELLTLEELAVREDVHYKGKFADLLIYANRDKGFLLRKIENNRYEVYLAYARVAE